MKFLRLNPALSVAAAFGALALAPGAFASAVTPDVAAQIKRGHVVFNGICFACHQHDGKGMGNIFPPLAHSDLLQGNPERAAWIVTHGLSGPLTVNGKAFNNAMPAQTQLNDQQVADVVTYILNSWGNSGGHLTPAEVKTERARVK